MHLSYTLARLCNILGDSYWMSGELNKGIEHHQRCREIAEKLKDYEINDIAYIHKINNLSVVSLLNTGLCYIDLWELEEAIKYFEDTIYFGKQLKVNQRNIENSILILAFLYSQRNLDFKQKPLEYLAQCNLDYCLYETSLWSIGYSYLFSALTYKNLRKILKSFENYQKAIKFAEEVDYPQVKAKALTGLAELYRIQNDFEIALTHHQESIAVLDKIGAKCDLAEAYFQLALTYQQMGDQVNSQDYFNKAIYLWGPEQIDAPKQIERVKKAMNCES